MRARSTYRWIGVGLVLACLWPAAARAQTDEVVYFYTDAVGSVRMTTDGAGTVLARYDFHPFGGEAVPPAPPTPDVMQFAGKRRDAETGLSYFGARYYAGQAGRFTTVDPVLNVEAALTDPQRWNRYAYARNNPLRYVDPDGRDPRVVGAVVGAAVYAGWHAYANIQQGRPWYENIGVEASKGLLVGVTLGLAAPAVASTAVDMGILAAPGGADVAVRAGRSTSIVLDRTSQGLQKFYTKHGDDFGLIGNWNPSRATEASRAIHQHVNALATRAISGTYRGSPVIHYLDPSTGLNVMATPGGNFVSGWKLSAEQLASILATGRLF